MSKRRKVSPSERAYLAAREIIMLWCDAGVTTEHGFSRFTNPEDEKRVLKHAKAIVAALEPKP